MAISNKIQVTVEGGLGRIGISIVDNSSITPDYSYTYSTITKEFDSSTNKYLYLIAEPEPGYQFIGWYQADNSNLSQNNPFGVGLQSYNVQYEQPVVNIKAKFNKIIENVITEYDSIINKGYKEGFNIDWSSSDRFEQNTMIVFSGTDNVPKSGFKFLYKQIDNKINCLLVYIMLQNSQTSVQHVNNNYWYLKINNYEIINSIPNAGNYQSPNPTKQITTISNPKKGVCEIIFQHDFPLSDVVSTNKFGIEFSWVSTGYVGSYTAISSKVKKSISDISQNQQTIFSWFKTNDYLYSGQCDLTSSGIEVLGLVNNTASYGQTITITGQNYVKLIDANVQDWENWNPNGTRFDLSQIQPNDSHIYPSTLTAIASEWND